MDLRVEARIKRLYDRKRRSVERIKKLREEKKEESLKDCTFKPVINNYQKQSRICILPNGSAISRKPLLTSEQAEYEKCTFKPKINKQLAFTRKVEGVSPRRKRSCSPPRKAAEKNMTLEVILGPGKKGNVVIRKGETAATIAHNFAVEYNLHKDIEGLLERLVEEKLEESANSRQNCT